MIKKDNQQELYKDYSKHEEDLKFDWTDIIAFIIAAFQVLLPYVLILGASAAAIMLLFQLIMN